MGFSLRNCTKYHTKYHVNFHIQCIFGHAFLTYPDTGAPFEMIQNESESQVCTFGCEARFREECLRDCQVSPGERLVNFFTNSIPMNNRAE